MPRAEAGTPKAIANQQKSKGLQRLRWYCQVCEKQCRDENGFKCHVQSEAHVRQMLIVGENPARYVASFSRQFMGDFLQLLRTTHGEKRVQANHFYASQYIVNKSHVHMNSTRWKTLTEFITFLGHEGICRVENTEKGWFISWVDNSPEALKKRDANLKRERLEKGEADREDRLWQEQIERAKQEALEKEMDAAYNSMYMKEEDIDVKAEEDTYTDATTEMKDVKSEDDVSVKTEDTEQPPAPAVSVLAIQKPISISGPAAVTLKKPINPLKSSNPLASKKSSNPLKSAMKKAVPKEESSLSVNINGKRPLPKAVEIMQEEQRLKRLREERYNRDHRDDRYRDHHRSGYRNETYVDSR
jgi:DNA/RNA-binding protein KIN17